MPNNLKPGIDYIGISTPFFCNNGKGLFVLHKRSKSCRDEQGRWDVGSGQLEFGESVEKGVLREIKEEYKCNGEIQEELPALSIIRKFNNIKTHWLAIPFLVRVNPEEVRIGEKDKIEAIGWFTLDKLPRPLHKGAVYTLKQYKKYFDKYL